MENLKSLSKKEMAETNGGLAFWATVGAGVLIAATGAAVNEIIKDWEHFKDGVSAAV